MFSVDYVYIKVIIYSVHMLLLVSLVQIVYTIYTHLNRLVRKYFLLVLLGSSGAYRATLRQSCSCKNHLGRYKTK